MFQYDAPAGLPVDQSKTKPTEQAAPTAAPEPSPATARRPSWAQVLEDRARMPGLRTARLPSVATVRAYHREREYVPWEAGILDLPARVHGWFAVAWCFGCTSIAFLGAGDFRRRLRKFRAEGLPGLCRAQLPRLKTLRGFPRVWVALWSAVCWPGLKFWGPITTGFYLLMIALPLLLSLIF